MIKGFLFKFLKGKLADASLATFIVDLLMNTPENMTVFKAQSGEELSAIGAVAAAGYLWGVIRRFTNAYKFDA